MANKPKTKPSGKVAIITRTKDRPVLLARAIESVINQSLEDWVQVIINDGGKKKGVDDLVKNHAKAYGDRILVVHNPKSLGMEAASNVGIEACESEYVIIHDDDDAWHPDFLEKTVAFLENDDRYENLGGVVTQWEKVWERIENENAVEESREDCRDFIKELTLWEMAAGNLFPPIAFLYKRAVFEHIGGMYNEKLPVLGDWEFNLRFMQHYDIGYIKEELAYYHHRVEGKGDIYANTVTNQVDRHHFYNEQIRNRFLRDDLQNNQMGMGYLLNEARKIKDQVIQKDVLIQHLNDQLGHRDQHILELEKQVAAEQEKIEALQLDVEAGHMRITTLEGQIHTIFNTLSWKITAPLRGVKSFIKTRSIFFEPHNYIKAIQVLRQEGIRGIRRRLRRHFILSKALKSGHKKASYRQWVEEFDTLTDDDRIAIKKHIKQFELNPLISVVMPVYNVDENFLREAITSIFNQLYTNWELCIADDCSTKPYIKRVLEEYQRKDDRVKVVFREENGHISEASNSALALANGEFVALLDHDDILPEHALYYIANEVNLHPDVDLIYSDEDKIDRHGTRYGPYFKPDWNPDLFYCQNMFSHLGVYRRAILEKIDGFRKGYEGSQDYDLALRALEHTHDSKIHHIPQVLYHWRAIPGSTALTIESKGYALDAARNAVSEYFARNFPEAKVEDGNEIAKRFGYCHIDWPVPDPAPEVTLIIPTRDNYKLLHKCVESILSKTTYPNYKLLIVNNQSSKKETLDYFEKLSAHDNVEILDYDKEFNFAALNNFAVKHCSSELVAFVNNDIEVITPDWLDEMVANALREEVGAVGAKLYYPSDTIQHAGITLGVGPHAIAHHSFWELDKEDTGYYARAVLIHSVSAVTAACMVMRREVFDKVNGFDEEHLTVAFNDVDLCLRIREQGYRIILNPNAELYHHESVSREYDYKDAREQRLETEAQTMRERWKGTLDNDPYYNPNLDIYFGDFSLAFPPRTKKPWRDAA